MNYPATPIPFDIDSVLTKLNASQWLDRYWDVLSGENAKVNLVSRETTKDSFRRIVAEALLPFTQFKADSRRYLDIGSGGGIPAIPLLLSGQVSGPSVFYERTNKKASALVRMLESLGLPNVNVKAESFGEQAIQDKFSLVTLSWVALTPTLLKSIMSALEPGAKLIYYSQPDFEIRNHKVGVFSYSQTPGDIHKYFSIITK